MATVREVVLPHHKKEDGTWNVKIRVSHKRKSAYIDTQHFVCAKQLRKDLTIKDSFIIDLINPVLRDFRSKISELEDKLSYYGAKSLAYYLESGGQIRAEDINIIEFGTKQIEKLKEEERDASAANMQTVVFSLIDYCKSDNVPITHIRAKFLEEYAKYLKSPRILVRPDQFGKPYSRKVNGLAKTGLHNHMRDLRILFNDVVEFYNDADMGIEVVKHYPFEKYKLGKPSPNTKAKLTVDQVRAIRDCIVPPDGRIEQAKELAMLSFYLCGMNAADLHKLPAPEEILKNRIDYNRSKTRSRRDDEAFMSVHIPSLAIPLYKKYAGKLQLKYSTHITLDQALSKGMKGLRELVDIPDLDFYDLRHAFGDWARNELNFHKDDVGDALNHKDPKYAVTDIYMSRSWKIIDNIQKSVIGHLNSDRLFVPKNIIQYDNRDMFSVF